MWMGDQTRISQMSCLALACNLCQPFENKRFDAFHAKVNGVIWGIRVYTASQTPIFFGAIGSFSLDDFYKEILQVP